MRYLRNRYQVEIAVRGSATGHTIEIPISDESQVGSARRAAAAMAADIELGAESGGRLAIIVTEAATNILHHAAGGYILLRDVEMNGGPGVELLGVDSGPGMSNIAGSMVDGTSTSGTPGSGLGAIRRLSDIFDLYSAPGIGTVVLAGIWSKRRRALPAGRILEIGVVSVPKPHQSVCGDAWAVRKRPDGVLVMVADGLGHGPEAAKASGAAVGTLMQSAASGPAEMLSAMHDALMPTRGAAIGIAHVSWVNRDLLFSGLGNVAGALVDAGQVRHLVSHDGIVGHIARRFQAYSYSRERGSLLILHSDGLTNRWQIERYPGLLSHHPAVIAGVLYRDYSRRSDDSTVLVAREAAA